MTQKGIALILFTASLALPRAATAQIAVNAGVLDVWLLPHHDRFGAYPYVAASVALPMGPVVVIPAAGIEWCPEAGDAWGGTATLTVDYPLSSSLGLDLNVALIHDQIGSQFSDALFFAGIGPGVSIIAGPWTVSPFVTMYQALNEDLRSWSPGINVAYTLGTPP